MPATNRRPTREEEDAAWAVADLKAWTAGFARSRKGNLWRRLDDGNRVTIVPGRHGGFDWLLSDDGNGTVERSPDSYRTERATIEAAWDVLYGG